MITSTESERPSSNRSSSLARAGAVPSGSGRGVAQASVALVWSVTARTLAVGALLWTGSLGARAETGGSPPGPVSQALAPSSSTSRDSGLRRGISLTPEQAREIGRRIWRNECGGTIEGLTSWNQGEAFPSLGIGHFIWFPAGTQAPFQESFPPLLVYLASRGVQLPAWLSSKPPPPCPWSSREAFLRDKDTPRLVGLRSLLAETVDLQTEFIIKRQEAALPRILEAAAPASRPEIERQYYRVAALPLGPYALIDYVNFKGEGVLASERYNGEGWGLLQVLENMHGTDPVTAVREYAASAKDRLRRRVANAPPVNHEERWLQGWCNRVDTYLK